MDGLHLKLPLGKAGLLSEDDVKLLKSMAANETSSIRVFVSKLLKRYCIEMKVKKQNFKEAS